MEAGQSCKMRPPTANGMRLAPLPSNSVTSASLAHMQAGTHGLPFPLLIPPWQWPAWGLRWGPCEASHSLALCPPIQPLEILLGRGGLFSHYCGIIARLWVVYFSLAFGVIHMALEFWYSLMCASLSIIERTRESFPTNFASLWKQCKFKLLSWWM